jgi:elongation factor G
VERALRVLDGSVAVFDGKEGVEPQSETVWRQADKYNVPRICFINKMDKLGADFYFSVQTIKDRLKARPIVMQLPIGAENSFEGVVDLVEMKALLWRGETEMGANFTVEEIPADLKDKAEEYHAELVEAVAETSEDLLEKYLGGEELTVEEIKRGVRKITVNSEGYPVFCGSAFKNKGVQPMLDAVIDYLPSPLDIKEIEGSTGKLGDETVVTRKASVDEPLSALAFKVATHPFYGKLIYVRVYSGKVSQGQTVANSTKDGKERIGKLFQMHSNKENPVTEAIAGHIYAFVGLKNTSTGDTLCDMQKQIVLESMTFPEPVIDVAIEPKTKQDQEKLSNAIQKLSEEDPTFRIKHDEESGQTVIGGMGELHLDVFVERMKREFHVEANVGKPQVAYRETIRKAVEKVEYTHKKQSGGAGQFAKVLVSIEPLDSNEGFYEFVNKITGGHIPKEYIPSVDVGIQDAMENGILAGYPLVGLKATLIDGAYHDVDSSELAFKIAGSNVLREAARRADPTILEPIMEVEVRTPEEYMGEVIGDLNSRRGMIQSMADAVGVKVVEAKVPLSEMFGYIGDLRSKTQGRAVYTMQFDSYAEVPKNIGEEIVKKSRGEE